MAREKQKSPDLQGFRIIFDLESVTNLNTKVVG